MAVRQSNKDLFLTIGSSVVSLDNLVADTSLALQICVVQVAHTSNAFIWR